MGILACWILGAAVLILAILWGMARPPMSPISDELKAIPEVQEVYEEGYEIWFYRSPPKTRYEHWVLKARKFGRAKAHLSADFIATKQCLYIANVCVDQRHRNKGLATAMLLGATRLTQCRALTTSGRTKQGAKFFEKNRLRLSRNGVVLHDGAVTHLSDFTGSQCPAPFMQLPATGSNAGCYESCETVRWRWK